MVAVIALDQLTKHTIAIGHHRRETAEHFVPAIKFVHVRNRGVAFGFFSGGGTLVLVFTLIALASAARLLRACGRPAMAVAAHRPADRRRDRQPDRPGLPRGGDRLHQAPAWPAFNVADMAITFGVLALLWVLESNRRDRRQR